jgi:hypothetical protein
MQGTESKEPTGDRRAGAESMDIRWRLGEDGLGEGNIAGLRRLRKSTSQSVIKDCGKVAHVLRQTVPVSVW